MVAEFLRHQPYSCIVPGQVVLRIKNYVEPGIYAERFEERLEVGNAAFLPHWIEKYEEISSRSGVIVQQVHLLLREPARRADYCDHGHVFGYGLFCGEVDRLRFISLLRQHIAQVGKTVGAFRFDRRLAMACGEPDFRFDFPGDLYESVGDVVLLVLCDPHPFLFELEKHPRLRRYRFCPGYLFVFVRVHEPQVEDIELIVIERESLPYLVGAPAGEESHHLDFAGQVLSN